MASHNLLFAHGVAALPRETMLRKRPFPACQATFLAFTRFLRKSRTFQSDKFVSRVLLLERTFAVLTLDFRNPQGFASHREKVSEDDQGHNRTESLEVRQFSDAET